MLLHARIEGTLSMTGSPAFDDVGILSRIATGDRTALGELYAHYGASLLGYVRSLTPDQSLAEEIVQDTLVAVWSSAGRYGGKSTVKTWLIGIARRQAHNTLRRRGLPLADPAALATLPAPDPTPEDVALAMADRAALAAALRCLAPAQREVLALIFGQELSYQEVANVLDIPIGTVRSRLNHAKRALRVLLESAEEVH